MIPSINANRDTRTAVLGLAAMFLIVAAGRGGPMVVRWQDRSVQATRSEIEQRDREGLLSRRLPASRAQRRLVSQLETQLDSAEVTATSAVGAGASLMSAIIEIADGTGVEISSTRLDDRVEDRGSPHRSMIEIAMSGRVEDVVVFLSTLEAGPPAIGITDVSMSRSSGSPGNGGAQTLQVTLKIEALVRRPSE